MRRLLTASITLIALTATASAAVVPRFLAGDVTVTVTYNGKGNVDDTHEILVFLFDHPNPGQSSMPQALQVITKSGGTATFKDVVRSPVYVTLVYDEAANYDGQGPRPPGAPIGSYQKDGKPVPVTPGPAAKIKASFDDSIRWK